jgi:putative colanic acid biosynthesis acetyltransferase WcaB
MYSKFHIFQDWKSNKGYFKGQLILVLFRLAHLFKSNKVLMILFCWYLFFYRFFVEWILAIELSWNLHVGSGLKLFHGFSLVVNGNTIIGDDCTLRHSTTIGNKGEIEFSKFNSPVIGNNVDIGANVCIIGPITIGDNVKIGAGSIVIKDVPANCIIAGNPARVIKIIQPDLIHD